MPAADSHSASPIRHGSPPVGSDGDGKSGRRGSARLPGSSSSPPRRARCASLSSLRSRRPTARRFSIWFPLAPEVELTVIYAAQTVAGRTWSVEPRHRTTFLRGRRLPGLARLLRHDYPVTPGIARALRGIAPGRRRRVRLEHVRVAGRDRLVVVARESRTCCSSRATISARAAPGGVRSREPSFRASLRKAAGALVVGTASRESVVATGRGPGTRACLREHDRRCRLGGARRRAARTTRRSCGRVSAPLTTTSSCSRSPGSGRRRVSTRSSVPLPQTRDARLLVVVAGDGPERSAVEELARASSVRLHLTGDLCRRRRRRDLRRRRHLRAPLDARDLGCRRQRGRGVGSAARALRPRRRRVRPAARRRERLARPCRRRRGDGRCARSGSPPTVDSRERGRSAVARARPRVGLRAFGRELRRRRARSCRSIDLFLHVGHAVPRHASCCRDASLRPSRSRSSASPRTLPDGVDHRRAVVGHDERLAVLEEPGDAAAVRDDDGRSRCGRLRRDHPEALARRGEHEDVRLGVQVARRLARSPAGCGSGRSSPCPTAPVGAPRRHRDGRQARRRRRAPPGISRAASSRCSIPLPAAILPDVEDRAARSSGMPSCARRVAVRGRAVRLGKAVAANVHLLRRSTPHATTSSPSRSDATTTAAAPRATPR